jgi:F-type H+-transporting ATPase subunit epsilon
MAGTVRFELVSPERILLTQDVEMVVVPGTEGNFGVLPGHAPLISTVRPGVIDVWENGAIAERLFIAGGFAEVVFDRCTVLADAAQPVASLNRTQAETELAAAKAALPDLRDTAPDGATASPERILAERRLAIAAAKLEALDLG